MNLTDVIMKDEKPVFLNEMRRIRRIDNNSGLPKKTNQELAKKSKKLKTILPKENGLSKRQSLWNLSKKCHYCECDTVMPILDKQFNAKAMTIDHLTPLSRGGKRIQDNEVTCCAACNKDKAHLTEGEYQAVLAYRKSLSTTPHGKE